MFGREVAHFQELEEKEPDQLQQGDRDVEKLVALGLAGHARQVLDADLAESATQVFRLDDHFCIDADVLGLDLEPLYHRLAHELDPVDIPQRNAEENGHHDSEKQCVHSSEKRVAPVGTIADDDVRLVHVWEVFLDVLWIELPVGWDDHHPGVAGMFQAGLLAASVADVEGMVDNPDPLVGARKSLRYLARPVPAAVIYDQHLVFLKELLCRLDNVVNRLLEVELLVERGDNQRDLLAVQLSSPSKCQPAQTATGLPDILIDFVMASMTRTTFRPSTPSDNGLSLFRTQLMK